MRRLSTRQLITSFLVKDRDMSADMLMHELAKHGLNLPKLVTGHFRSTIRAVLLYLIDQGLLNLVELKTEDEFGLHPEQIATTMPFAEARAWQDRLRAIDDFNSESEPSGRA